MTAHSDAPPAKPAAKISLVEAACARFESAPPAAAPSAAAPQDSAANPFKQHARERLRLLQGSGLGAASDLIENQPAPAQTHSPAAQGPSAYPSALRIHIAWAALSLALAAALVLQLNQNAGSAPIKPAAAAAKPLAPGAYEPLELQLEKSLLSRPVPRP